MDNDSKKPEQTEGLPEGLPEGWHETGRISSKNGTIQHIHVTGRFSEGDKRTKANREARTLFEQLREENPKLTKTDFHADKRCREIFKRWEVKKMPSVENLRRGALKGL